MLLVFSKLENHPGLWEVESRPFSHVLVDCIGVESGGVSKHYISGKTLILLVLRHVNLRCGRLSKSMVTVQIHIL